MLIKDRCIGVFDLESPELDAFTKEHKELLTLLASQAAVAIENARLYEEVRRNEERIEKELRFAQRVQVALLPTELPTAAATTPTSPAASSRRASSEATSTISWRPSRTRSSSRSATCRARARRRRSTAPLPRSWCARARCAAAITPDRFSVAGVLQAMNTILHERQLEEYYCTLCYAFFDFKRARADAVELRAAVSDPLHRATDAGRSSCPACRSGRFPASPTTRSTLPLQPDDVFVFCTDGIFEAMNEEGEEFGARRVCEVVSAHRHADGARDRRRDLRRGRSTSAAARRRTTT